MTMIVLRAAALAAILLLCAPGARAQEVFLPASESVGPAPDRPGTGLSGFYWKRAPENNGQAERIAGRYRPEATFTATRVDYPGPGVGVVGRVPLRRFLGDDASSLRGAAASTGDNMFCLLAFRGFLKITRAMDVDAQTPGIQVVFVLGSDDGARLKIGGETVISRNGFNPFTFTGQHVRFEQPGLYPVDLLYYENFGVGAGVKWVTSIPGGPDSGRPPGTASIVPTAILYPATGPTVTARNRRLAVGWSDEMSAQTRPLWTSVNGAEIAGTAGGGALTVRVGPTARGAFRSAATRTAEVDLDRYPILAVRALDVSREAHWYVALEEPGGDARIETPNRSSPGLIFFDLPAQANLAGKRALRIRLIVEGLRNGESAEFAWVRFVRRDDAERLRENPDEQRVRLVP